MVFNHLLLSNNDVLLKFPLNHSIQFLIHKSSKHLPALFARHVGIQSLHRAQSQLSWKELANSKWSTNQPGVCLKMVDSPMHCHWKVGKKNRCNIYIIFNLYYIILYYNGMLLGSNPWEFSCFQKNETTWYNPKDLASNHSCSALPSKPPHR